MRLLAYFILAYVTLGLQLGLGHYANLGGAAPNLVLLAAIFVAANAPRDAALPGAFCLGLMQDLLGLGPPGLYAVAYGLVALVVLRTQHSVYRDHSLTHLSVTLIAGLIVACVVMVHGWIRPAGPKVVANGLALAAVRAPVGGLFVSAIYTAILAPPMLWALAHSRRFFAFRTARARGW
jgi:rod shape-determining protein MreD